MMVRFGDAHPGDTAGVYVLPPGHDSRWVTDEEYLTEELWDPITVKRQVWKLLREVEVTFHPNGMLCTKCSGDGSFVSVLGPIVDCSRCNGSGDDPLAGTQTVKEL